MHILYYTVCLKYKFYILFNNYLPIIIKTRTRHKPEVSKLHIPKGYIKNCNPNFNTEIKKLIKIRNTLRSKRHLSNNDTLHVQRLNQQIKQKQDNWEKFTTEMNYQTDSKNIWQTTRDILNVKTKPPPTHSSATLANGKLPSRSQESNRLMKYFASRSRLHNINRSIKLDIRKTSRELKTLKLDHEITPPFTTDMVTKTLKQLNNSGATGIDGISNQHLKHLGPKAHAEITSIFNQSVTHNQIPTIWKRSKIIPLLKPGKSPTQSSSFRPITLLCCLSKALETLMLTRTSPYMPTVKHQHGYKKQHSTTTYLTNLTQFILDGFNLKKPAKRTIMATLDIEKAFGSIPKHILIKKIFKTKMHNNDKKWLANLLTDRRSYVQLNNTNSKLMKLANGVPQGGVISPMLFNLFLHDLPDNKDKDSLLLSYADDITVAIKHSNWKTAERKLQNWLNKIQNWLKENLLKVSPPKSSVTLLTPDRRHESNIHPNITLQNAQDTRSNI